jgi:hypothetical protein
MFKKVLVLTLCMSCVLAANSQRKKNLDIKANGEFYSGEIRLTSGEVIKCELQYHFRSGVLYEKYHENRTRPYGPNNVVSFQFRIKDKVRRFYSLPFPGEDVKQFGFFEVLYEHNQMAVLSNYHVSYTQIDYQTNSGGKEISEVIYLVEGDKGIKPFLVSTEFGELLAQKRKIGSEDELLYKLINKSSVEEFFGSYHSEVIEYAKQEKLKLKRLKDLIIIMHFYADLK